MNDAGEQNQYRTVIGADVELGNFILKATAEDCTCRAASRALLAEVDGVLADRTADAYRREGLRLARTAFGEAVIRDLDVSQASKSVVDHAVWGMAWLGRRRRSCQAAKCAG